MLHQIGNHCSIFIGARRARADPIRMFNDLQGNRQYKQKDHFADWHH